MAKENQMVRHEDHPNAFHVFGPRNLTPFDWRDLVSSRWNDTNYKRTVIACLIQSVYLLELDRQERRTQQNALAPNWWIPFKYKLTRTLIDKRDGSIYGAIFEWNRYAAMTDLVPIKPIGAPRVVVALRGTLLKGHTWRRDIEDDFRFIAWESLKGSVRFKESLEVLKSISDTHGSRNVCIAAHSLGAAIGLQVGNELAKEGIFVEGHLFNPPSASLAMSLGNIGEIAEYVWNGLKFMLPFTLSTEAHASTDGDKNYIIQLERLIHRLSMNAGFRSRKWEPQLYVNRNDYISFFYEKITDKENMSPTAKDQNVGKLCVVSKESQRFREAHSLRQWWSNDAELQQDIHNSKLINMQLKSLNSGSPSQVVILLLYPHCISLAMSFTNIRGTVEFARNMLQYVPHSGWISRISGLKDAGYWVGKWIPYQYVYIGTPWEITHLFNPSSVSLAMSLSHIGEKAEFVWKWRSLKSIIIPSRSEAQVSNDGDNISDVVLKSWIPGLSSFKDTGSAVGKWLPLMYSNKSDYISRQLRPLYCVTHSQVSNLLYLPFYSPLKNNGEKTEFVWNRVESMSPSSREDHVNVSNDGDKTAGVVWRSWKSVLIGLKNAGSGVGKLIPNMYVNKSHENGEKIVDKENA